MADRSAGIELYTWKTPNGRKISIALEELGLSYTAHAVNLNAREQYDPAFVEISPYSKIPALVDLDGPDGAPISLFESGAILIYLAEKTGRLLPTAARPRLEVLQWLMWQMGNFGPMLGQAHHFRRSAKEKVPYAIERYTREAGRLYSVLDRHLAGAEFIAGGAYSIADIATYPWAARHTWHAVELADYPNVKRWYDMLGARPAVAKGMVVPVPE